MKFNNKNQFQEMNTNNNNNSSKIHHRTLNSHPNRKVVLATVNNF